MSMPYKKGLAEKALNENLQRFVDTKQSPKDHNLHVALIQIANMLEAVTSQQRAHDAQLATIEQHLPQIRAR